LELSTLSRWGMSTLLVCLLFVVGWSVVDRFSRDANVESNRDVDRSADIKPQPEPTKRIEIQMVPLWNNDGFREFSIQLESSKLDYGNYEEPLSDTWKYEVEILRRKMAKFDAESF
ncbi:MAG: hypothetical protein J0M26_29335, partial [Planctomycetes bacterium]|nr:hypothetical protein [Planctomycetota bacterium]